MSSEVFFMGVVPVIVALGAGALSFHSMVRAPGFLQRLLGGSTLVMTVGSVWILMWMLFRDAWPTALPHLIIALTAVIAVIQWRLAVRSSRAA
jgi:hypothetical protein